MKKLSTLMTAALLGLSGCAGAVQPTPGAPRLIFEVRLSVDSEGATIARLGVRNTGTVPFPEDEALAGMAELRDAAGLLQHRSEIMVRGPLAPGEVVFPYQWRGELAVGEYQLTWGAEGYGSTVASFTIVERDGRLSLSEETTRVFDGYGANSSSEEGDYGEAQPLVDLAKAGLSERLGVDVDEITVRSVKAVEFSDTSLGVPEPGKMYAQVITPGYVIMLSVDDTVYEYHGSGDHIVLVPDR